MTSNIPTILITCEHEGEKKRLCISEWAKITGKKYDFIHNLYTQNKKGKAVITNRQMVGLDEYTWTPPKVKKPEKKNKAQSLMSTFLSTPLVKI